MGWSLSRMNRPEITLILARAANGVIGAGGKMAWHLLADLCRFKQLTMGRPMIMGRKNLDSMPGILEGGRHTVVTVSAEGGGGKECVSQCITQWSRNH